MNLRRSLQFLSLIAALSIGGAALTACEEEGTAEQVGEKADQALESAGEAARETQETVEESAGEAGMTGEDTAN